MLFQASALLFVFALLLDVIGLTNHATTQEVAGFVQRGYRSAVDGTLEKAARLDGRLDRDGKPIRGSGSVTHLDVGSAEVRDQFRDRVLDFWLKGKYRKKARRK